MATPDSKSACPGSAGPVLPLRVRVANRVALVAGLFSLAVAVALAAEYFHYQKVTPLNAPTVAALKAELLLQPLDEPLKQRLRAQDLALRRHHDHHLMRVLRGQWLLLGGMVVFLAALQAAQWRKRLCIIKKLPQPGEEFRALLRAAGAVGLLTVGVAAGAMWLASQSTTRLDLALQAAGRSAPGATDPAAGGAMATSGAAGPAAADWQRQWPQFRGPNSDGLTTATNLPLTWNGKTGENIRWKTAVPLPGFNSPIVWSNRVFLSGGNAERRAVFCFDASSGQLVWEQAVPAMPGGSAEKPEIPEQTGYAAATMATDGQRVFAMFATYELVAFNFDGKLAWSKHLGVSKNPHGHATSLLVWRDRLILQLDQGEPEDRLSKLLAYEAATGKVIWQKSRAVASSWASPIVIEAAGKPQIITLSVPWIQAYAVADGAELWKVEGLGGEVTPTPALAGGLVMAMSPSEKLLAIKPDGQGDVSKTHVAWKYEDNIPDITSPAVQGDLLFMVTTMGMVTALDVKTGAKVWEKDLQLDCHPSPLVAGSRLYLFTTKGITLVAEAGREFKELARNELEEKVYASPAPAGDCLYLRSEKNLYCIGRK